MAPSSLRRLSGLLRLLGALAVPAGRPWAGAAGPASFYGVEPPAAPRVARCGPAPGGLRVDWHGVPGADLYEVQLAHSPEGQAFAVLTDGGTSATFADAMEHTRYWARVRAHAAAATSLGPGSWGVVGTSESCLRGSIPEAPDGEAAAAGAKSFWMEVMRESEFTYDVDYLANHNSGTVLGDAGFITSTMNSSFLNVSFPKATFSLYCVEVLRVDLPNSTTTGGDNRFADYLSCNDGGDPLNSTCECDNWIDRVLANQDPDKACHNRKGGPCGPKDWGRNCTCTCERESLDQSSRYIGMMPVFLRTPVQLGHWYSMPKKGECAEGEELGTERPDGSSCTWRRRPDARVARGWEVLEHGFNSSSSPSSFVHVDPAQVRQNEAAFRAAFAAAPLRPFRCGSSEGGDAGEALVV